MSDGLPIRATLPGEGAIIRRAPRGTPRRCVSSEGCDSPPLEGGRFCERHQRELDAVRAALQHEFAEEARRRERRKPTTPG